MNVGKQRVYGLKSLLEDYYQWSDHKKRNRTLAYFAVSSFFIAEIAGFMVIYFVGGAHALS